MKDLGIGSLEFVCTKLSVGIYRDLRSLIKILQRYTNQLNKLILFGETE
jgi:hypothetical protein